MSHHYQPPTSVRKKKREFEIFLLRHTTNLLGVITFCALASLWYVAHGILLSGNQTLPQRIILIFALGLLLFVVINAHVAGTRGIRAEAAGASRRRMLAFVGAGFGALSFSVIGYLSSSEAHSATLILTVVTAGAAIFLFDGYSTALLVWAEIWLPTIAETWGNSTQELTIFTSFAALGIALLVAVYMRSILSFALSDQHESLSLAAKLSANNQHLRMFFLAANHDLSQPLTSLKFGLRSIYELTDPSSPMKEHIDRMLSASETLTRLIADIVGYEKVASGVTDIDHTRTPLQSIFDRVVSQTEQLVRTKNIGLWCRPTSLHLESGSFIVERIIRNLAENAIKNTHDGRVLIAVRPHGNTVSIEVWDTGVGIDPSSVDRVFDLFYQNKGANGRPLGHGIGLTIVRALAEEIGATILVHTKPGKGSVFKLILAPGTCVRSVVTTPTRVAPTSNLPSFPRSWAGVTIAVLEDDDVLRFAITNSLSKQEAAVIQAASTAELMEQLAGRASTIDILLTDWTLGKDTGEAAALALRKIPGYRGRWIVISGNIPESQRNRLLSIGVTVLAKPFTPDALAETINQALVSPPEARAA